MIYIPFLWRHEFDVVTIVKVVVEYVPRDSIPMSSFA